MFCSSCGKPVPDGSKFCPECGAGQGSPEQGYQPIMYQGSVDYAQYAPPLETVTRPPLNKDARTGLICGIVSLATMFFPVLNGVPGILGIIFSYKGLKKSEELREAEKERPSRDSACQGQDWQWASTGSAITHFKILASSIDQKYLKTPRFIVYK